jgi:hypothetical protein
MSNIMGGPHPDDCECHLCSTRHKEREDAYRAMRPTATSRYQRPHQQPPRPQSIRDPEKPTSSYEQEQIQRCFRLPRWASVVVSRCAEDLGQSDSAVMRAWVMDAASEWLKDQGEV